MNDLTIISHFYNEEYLLPHWLNHHKKIFKNGIMIDYDSTDNSVEIIKEICPEWRIVKSVNVDFDHIFLNHEVENYEREINGFRICLNTTEFILGNFDSLTSITEPTQLLVPPFCMIENPDLEYKELEGDLIKTRTWGFDYKTNFNFKMARSLHNYPMNSYPVGRHFTHYNTEEFVILWYGFSPFNEQLLKRKLQIQNKMSQRDKSIGAGFHHITTKEKLYGELQNHQKISRDLSEDIDNFLKLTFNK
jgi:hypothetical protein